MARTVYVFTPMLRALKAIGLTKSTNSSSDRWWTIWNYVVLFAEVEFIIITIYGTVTDKTNFYLKIEYMSFICTNVSVLFRVILMTIKKKELFSLFEKMEALLQHMEVVSGTNSLLKLKKKCLLVAVGYSIMYILIAFNVYVVAYVKYYFEGVEDPTPFEVPVPFEKRNNIHAVVWYEVFQFYSSIAGYAVTNICFITISLATAESIKKLAEGYRRINTSNVYSSLRQTAKWHSEVVELVKETNSLLSPIMMIDFLLSLQFISICGFLLVKVGTNDSASFSKYITLYLAFLSCPLSFCLGGHIVSLENDALYDSVHENEWYLLPPKARKELILPTAISSKGLSWNYRGVVVFNMSLYLSLVKQSYSLITFLKIVT